MKNKKTKSAMALVFIILISSLIFIIAEGKINKSLNLDKAISDTLKNNSKLQKIEINSSKIYCDNSFCYADIYQENLINTKFMTKRYKCVKQELKNAKDENSLFCSKEEEKTSEELIIERDNFIKKRLIDYAQVINKRNLNNKVDKTGEEIITN